MGIVVQNVKRANRQITDAMATYGVATVHEAQGRKGLMAPRIRPIYGGTRISGTALTVSVAPCDNWMIHVAAELCQDGDILVVAPTSYSDAGYFGDLLGTLMKSRGAHGVVLDAGCRDIADLKEMGFPVWSNAVSAQGTVKETLGDVNIPVVCGGQTVNPGDIVVADDDGVVIVARTEAADVLENVKARDEKEAGIRKRYAAGELGLDMNNMRPALEAKGLVYVDQADLPTE